MKRHFILTIMIFTAMVANLAAQTLSEIQKKAKQETNKRVEKAIEEVLSEEKIDLPASVKSAERLYESAVKKSVKVFEDKVIKAMDVRDKEVQKAQSLFLKKLETGMKSETKKGNLEGALAIKAKIETLKPSNKERSSDSKKNVKRISPSKVKQYIVGRWKYFAQEENKHYIREFKSDDTCTVSDDKGKVYWTRKYEVKAIDGTAQVHIKINSSLTVVHKIVDANNILIDDKWKATRIK